MLFNKHKKTNDTESKSEDKDGLTDDMKNEISDIIKNADACLIFTGAGMGVDSGLSVFRGNEGLWEQFPDAKNLNLSFQGLANPQNYDKHPNVVIPFYLKRHDAYVNADPHSGYYELFGFVSSLPNKYFITTSNVDGLMQKTGFEKERIHEEHGSIMHWQCSSYKCSHEQGVEGLVNILDFDVRDIDALKCKHCEDRLRPNICMFYDMSWMDSIYNTQEILFQKYYNNLLEKRHKNVAVIEIGAGEAIRTIRSKAENCAYELNTKLIRINPDQNESFSDKYTIHVNKGAAEGISQVLSSVDMM